ncbi:hypothetical protein K525DRAFT_207544 [Schizophyllum commune Loenen D]|nr:hypothetical protein K525DRAFT_207544 [Schizophyllum commune Loenen D]
MDEMLYEDDVADDDGQAAVDPADQDDEEAKEVEERLKREYIQANKMRDGYIDADDDEMPKKISKSAKRMQRMIRQREGNNAYESDDDENPYASSEEEESEEEELLPSQAPLTQPPPGQPPTQPPQAPKLATNGAGPVNAPHDSRPGSPVSPTSPSLGGHSIVAKRATSPKFKQTVPSGSGSRAGSPLAGAARGGSPSGGRAGSPVANGQASSNKRKAPEDGQSPTPGAPPRTKKRKHAPLAPLEDRHVIDWLREHDKVTTRECIQHFTPYLKDEGVKAHFTRLVKEVAQLKAGQLVLKAQYREPGSAPPATPSVA